ncbi:MAG: L-threonylcarbamoyladenylate synthase [Mangrovicoccus sp.]|nr:L-threonylcarbamoyladenylate synthase [Mangrovicoccus sp.]
MKQFTAEITPGKEGIVQAAELLAAGKLVAFPTETVYGLGADARNDAAVQGIYQAKGRPSVNPLIVHIPAIEQAENLAIFSDLARCAAQAFWPGPLTLVLPLRPGHGLSDRVTAGLGTVGLRVPAAPVARALLTAFDGPVAAPSANPSGRISPTTAAHVLSGLSGRIAAVVDGGPCAVGVESSILDLSGGAPELLRAGGISQAALEAALGRPVINQAQIQDNAQPNAPGQMSSHYAPRARLRLNAKAAEPGEVYLGFGPTAPGNATLSASGDLAEAAAQLFAMLHRLDAQGVEAIAVAPIPERGLGQALNDRLRRAAAPRPSS